MISLESFISKYTGKKVDVPWGYAGQCVSLVQRYLNECLAYEMHPRGNAKDWVNTLINEGIAQKVNGTPQRGDILVYGSSYGSGYGHIGIAVGDGNIFDQNNTSHNGGLAGKMRLFGTYSIMRPYRKPPYDGSGEKVDQILHKGSKVKFNGTFYVNSVRARDNTFVSNTLIGGNPTREYHHIPSGPFEEVGGNNRIDQVLYAGSIVKNDNVYVVQQIDIPTDSAMLNIDGRNVWIKSKYLLEV